jgi:hypothetical protein
MKTTKPEPPSKADPKSPRRPRPLTPAPWLDEVRPDEDVMAVFYGRTPAPAPAPVADPPAPAVEPASDAPGEPVSRSPEIRSPGLQRETEVSRSAVACLPKETGSDESGLPLC